MKLTPFLFAFALMLYPASSQTTTETESETEEEVTADDLENVEDDENRLRRWECSLPGGQYSVILSAITSVSKHSYILDGTLLVTEVNVDTTGTALARFYFIEPITDETNFNALDRIRQRAEQLRNQATTRAGTKADEMAQKSYPTTTHARTIEYRVMTEVELNTLYSSIYRSWTSGKGRSFRIK